MFIPTNTIYSDICQAKVNLCHFIFYYILNNDGKIMLKPFNKGSYFKDFV